MALLALAGAESFAGADNMKVQAFLVWGTNESKPPDGKAYNPVGADIQLKLKDLPLKWTNWFEVNRKEFVTPAGSVSKISMSDKCQILLSRTGPSDVEVGLIGKGKEVVRRRQSLPKGEMLVLGGNAPNATAWLVVLKRIE
jgi:hypothetical protein